MKRLLFALSLGVGGLMLTTTGVHAQGTAPDHLLCYKMSDTLKLTTGNTLDMLADLQPEFTQRGCTLLKPAEFCVPASKVNVKPPPPNPNLVGQPLQGDYICYVARCPKQVNPPSKVVTDQFGTHQEKNYQPVKVCVPAVKNPVECRVNATGITGAAMCGGACPDPAQTCHFDVKGKTCTCVSQTTCGGKPNSANLCGGPCLAADEVCRPEIKPGTTSLICACQKIPPPQCGLDPTTGTCGGACTNPADKCSLDATGQCSCQSGSQPCSIGANGCGGTCPLPSQQCHPDATGVCSCLIPCGQNPLNGQCGGECPNTGDVCVLTPTGCGCQPPANLPCSVDTNGVCGGICPAGSSCGIDSTGACNCQPPPSPCGMLPGTTNQCGGACPAPSTCQLINSATGAPFCGCK